MAIIEICPITGKSLENYNEYRENIMYDVSVGEKYSIDFCRSCLNKKEFRDNVKNYVHILCGILMDGKLEGQRIHWGGDKKEGLDLKRVVEEGNFPKTPSQKLDNLFMGLANNKIYEGQLIEIKANNYNLLWHKYYFKNRNEFYFYFEVLINEGYIEKVNHEQEKLPDRTVGDIVRYRITYKGLEKTIALQEEGENSKNCFIAMSFDEGVKEIRSAIKGAISNTGFQPILVDEVNHDAEKTINDAIIANLKKSKFCIADFTEQKDGVYFEAGYALGRGLKVIYTCQEEWFNKSHFDTNHFPHIIYKDTNELKEKLIDKIEAWIK